MTTHRRELTALAAVSLFVALAACRTPRPEVTPDPSASASPEATTPPPRHGSTGAQGDPAEPGARAIATTTTSSEPSPPVAASTPPRPPPDAGAEREPTCVPLPAVRPRDLTVRFLRTIVPHGRDIERQGLELHAEAGCPAVTGPRASLPVVPCRRLSAAQLDQVYAEVRRSGFEGMKSDGARLSSPHYGSRYLSVHWGNHACTVGDSPQHPIRKSSEAAFFRLIDTVVSAGP